MLNFKWGVREHRGRASKLHKENGYRIFNKNYAPINPDIPSPQLPNTVLLARNANVKICCLF